MKLHLQYSSSEPHTNLHLNPPDSTEQIHLPPKATYSTIWEEHRRTIQWDIYPNTFI